MTEAMQVQDIEEDYSGGPHVMPYEGRFVSTGSPLCIFEFVVWPKPSFIFGEFSGTEFMAAELLGIRSQWSGRPPFTHACLPVTRTLPEDVHACCPA